MRLPAVRRWPARSRSGRTSVALVNSMGAPHDLVSGFGPRSGLYYRHPCGSKPGAGGMTVAPVTSVLLTFTSLRDEPRLMTPPPTSDPVRDTEVTRAGGGRAMTV